MPDVVSVVADPSVVIQRIGSVSHDGPLAWPALDWVRQSGGVNRFDDPRGSGAQFTVLYGATEREACFAEILDQFRPGHSWLQQALARVKPLPADDPDNFDTDDTDILRALGMVPVDFLASRRIASFRITSKLWLLDVRISATATADALSVHTDMLPLLRGIGRPRIKPGDFSSNDRPLTQAIALWAHEHEFGGLVYTSSHDLAREWTCWALFPHVRKEVVSAAEPISLADSALRDVAERFKLRIEATP
jgi:hypothetical protein